MTPGELTAQFLLDYEDEILARQQQAVDELPGEQAGVRAIAGTPQYREMASTLIRLLAASCRDETETGWLEYARERARLRLKQNVSTAHIMRLSSLLHQSACRAMQEYSGSAEQISVMSRIFEERLSDFEIAFAEAYQEARDAHFSASQSKYYWLLENASEAILAFVPGEGRIIEANAQAERLLGRSRDGVLATPFVDLFGVEHRAQAQWLVEQDGRQTELHESSLRLDDVTVRRPDDSLVPVSLSCNWIETGEYTMAQVILRDMTQLRQMQQEMQSYARQLEGRVAERTRELQQSEDRYRELYLQEQRRAQHLSLINEVQKCALATRDVETFILQVTRAIQSHFRECDVTFMLRAPEPDEVLQGLTLEQDAASNLAETLADETIINTTTPGLTEAELQTWREASIGGVTGGDLVVMAQAGGHGFSPAPGTVCDAREGLPGETVQGAVPIIHHYDEVDESVEYAVRSEACIPLSMSDRAIGALLVQCSRHHGLEARDLIALQTSCAIIAAHIEWNRLFQQMQELNSFNHTLITTMLHSLLVLSEDGTIRLVNERCCETLHRTRKEILNHPLTDILGEDTARRHNLGSVLKDVTDNGTPYEIPEVQIFTPEGMQVFDIRLFRLYFRGAAQVVVLLINITRRWRQTQQLQVMNQISHLFQTSLDIDRVLHTVLVCITAGTALGFNRAFLLLLNDKKQKLTGADAIGPGSSEEAGRIWLEMSRREPTLEELLAGSSEDDSALRKQIQNFEISLTNPCFAALAEAIHEQRAAHLQQHQLIMAVPGCEIDENTQTERDATECAVATRIFTAPEAVIAPLIAKDHVVGIVLADNLYSGAPIEPEDVQLLETLAHQAGLAVDNALTYQALQKAQNELVSAERLVAVGEMAARVSHEIRNPLSTIGGFARSVLKRPEDTEAVERKSRIVVDEVERLEELLSDWLDMARPRSMDLQPHDLKAIVEHALLLADADIKAAGVTVEKNLEDLPPILVDRSRLLQALLNITRNGAQAMSDGGTLFIALRRVQRSTDGPTLVEIEIRDTGIGMTPRALKQVFVPFFSTKVSGSGLGLAITRRIIEDHGGDTDVFSQEGSGTTFILSLPYRTTDETEPVIPDDTHSNG